MHMYITPNVHTPTYIHKHNWRPLEGQPIQGYCTRSSGSYEYRKPTHPTYLHTSPHPTPTTVSPQLYQHLPKVHVHAKQCDLWKGSLTKACVGYITIAHNGIFIGRRCASQLHTISMHAGTLFLLVKKLQTANARFSAFV